MLKFENHFLGGRGVSSKPLSQGLANIFYKGPESK